VKTIFKFRISKILLILLFLYSLFGFIVLPYLIQSNFTKVMKDTLNTTAYLNRVYINPFTFEVALHKLIIQDDKHKTLLYIKSFETDFELLELLKKEIQLDYIYLDSLKTSLTLYNNKSLNFAHILNHLDQTKEDDITQETTKKDSAFIFTINELLLTDTQIEFIDETKSQVFHVKTKPFNFKMENFSTKENAVANLNTNIDIINTANLNIKTNLSMIPMHLNGDIALTKVQLPNIYSYLEDDLKFQFSGLVQNISSTFDINVDNNTLNAELDNLNLNIPNINYKDDSYSISLKKLNHTVQKINIEKNDSLIFDINNLILSSQNIEFKDAIKNKNLPLNFKDLTLNIDTFSSNKEKPSNIILALKTPSSGILDLKLTTKQEPLTITGKANIKQVDIVPYKEYVKEFANLETKKTFLDINTKIDIQNSTQNIDADIKVSNIDLFHSLTEKRLLYVKQFDINGLKYTNNNLFIQDVILNDFETVFKIDEKKNTNIDGLLVEKDENIELEKSEETQSQSKFHYYVKNLTISNGKTEFSDHSLPLNFDTKIHSLNAKINDISSKNKEADISLNGTIDKYGLAKINAKSVIADFKDKTTVSVNFENLDVKSFSPYSGKFIGQKIADGRLWLDLNYSISKAHLLSTNNIKIKNLTLGEDVESEEAMSLPIGLAIALLEDSDGLIELDVPIKGDMENPEFELGGVIWKTLGNVITNIVTAPFRFLGSLLGMDSDELGTIEFNFAQAQILPPQKEKLDKLLEVLQKKKNLILVLQPTINIFNDSKYLKDIKFEEIIISDDKNAMIEQIYLEKFGEKSFELLKEKIKEENLLEVLKEEIKTTITISTEELNSLGRQRVLNMKAYFISNNLILDRIQIKKDILETQDNNTDNLSLKLELNIRE